MISRNFIKSSMIYSVIGALPFVAGIILIPFFTSTLTTDQFGVNALYFSLITLFQVIINYCLDMYIGVRYFDYMNDPAQLKKHIGSVFSIAIFYGLLVIAVILALGPRVYQYVFGPNLSLYPWGIFTILTAFFNGIIKCYSSLLINQQRPLAYLWINATNFILIVVTTLTLLYLYPYTLNGPVLGRLLPSIFSGIVVLILVNNRYGITLDRSFIKKIVLFTTPLVIYAFLNWGIFNIDRFIIVKVLKNVTYVGIFDISSKLALALELICAGLASAINPRVFIRWKENKSRESDKDVMKYYNGFMAVVLLAIPLLVFSAPILIRLFIHKTVYYEATQYLMILSLGFIPRVHMYMYITPLYYYNKTSYLPRAFLFASAFQLTLTYVLVSLYGLWGAAWSSFLAKIAVAFFVYLECRKVFKFKVNVKKQFYLPLSYIITMMILDQFVTPGNNLIVYGLSILLGSSFVLFAFRKEIRTLSTTIFRSSDNLS